MTRLICCSTGKSITLVGEPLANSGEGKVWRTNENGYLAKIYHSPTPERVQKLTVMTAHPPTEPNSHLNHISFAWPKSSLKNDQGDHVGFLMPEIKGANQLLDIYNPKYRKALNLQVDWRFLHRTAQNIASIIAALHNSGYVLGDIKQQNILVNNQALPSIIDTDSFQVRHPQNGKVYRCLVGSQGYTPPELIGKDFSSIDQTEVHDRFRLAVIIYQLLFGGESPFGGKWIGAGETPEMDELIRHGLWLYAPNSPFQPVERTIPIEIVHPDIQRCFLRCFNDGHKNPHLRPKAMEWLAALKVASNSLMPCQRIDGHYYSQTYGKCYWCDRSTNLGVDIFPGVVISKPSVKPTQSEISQPAVSKPQSLPLITQPTALSTTATTSSSVQQTQSQLSQTSQLANLPNTYRRFFLQAAGELLTVVVMQNIFSYIQDGEFRSSLGMDYTKLRDLLAEGKWKEANEFTTLAMLAVIKKTVRLHLGLEFVDSFSCEDIRIIDKLWVKYSNGRFGFSVQKRIYQSLGGTQDEDQKIWRAFGKKVGWISKDFWLNYYGKLTFDTTAPEGHLPIGVVWGNFQVLTFNGSWKYNGGRGWRILFSCSDL